MYKFLILSVFCIYFVSCVPSRQYGELQRKQDVVEYEMKKVKRECMKLSEENTELQSKLDLAEGNYNDISRQNDDIVKKQGDMRDNMFKVSKDNKSLLGRLNNFQEGSDKEIEQLLDDVRHSKEALYKRELELNKLAKDLKEKEENLNSSNQNLALNNKKLNQLQLSLKAKDKAVNDLKSKLSDALTSFEGNGLSIEKRQGKVYVSMDETLLFKSGKYDVGVKGRDALTKLADILSLNKNIEIMIEGHTDNIEFNGKGSIIDNWDLSTKRATSIVRIMTLNKMLNPKRLTVAGRSSYLPISGNDTEIGRAKNRRTEIILSPNLNDLFNILK